MKRTSKAYREGYRAGEKDLSISFPVEYAESSNEYWEGVNDAISKVYLNKLWYITVRENNTIVEVVRHGDFEEICFDLMSEGYSFIKTSSKLRVFIGKRSDGKKEIFSM